MKEEYLIKIKQCKDQLSAWIIDNKKIVSIFGICLFFIFTFYFLFIAPPSNFPIAANITIEKGNTLEETSNLLYSAGYIRSPSLFSLIVAMMGNERSVVSGDYIFDKPLNVFSIINRICSGKFGLIPRRITIFEGLSNKEIAQLLKDNLKNFDDKLFISLSQGKDGYLFPDTYLFFPNVKPKEVISIMESNFNTRTKDLRLQADKIGKSFNDILIMASIIEKETQKTEDMKIVSGILWKRISMKMPLQVDVTFDFINGKTTKELSTNDLKIDSPYNTYNRRGLPPTPIANPGLRAIEASLNPKSTQYLYFLTDNNGVMHYSRTYNEHLVNKNLYLK